MFFLKEEDKELNLKNHSIRMFGNLISFKNLLVLDISYNELEEIPSSILLLSNLKHLNAMHNKIKMIPFELGTLPLLTLKLQSNPIEDDLSAILKYNNINFLKSYIRVNKNNCFDWKIMNLFLKYSFFLFLFFQFLF